MVVPVQHDRAPGDEPVVTYFNLRKHAPEPVDEEPETPDTEETEETEEADENVTAEQPTSWGGAFLTGVRGPGAWLATRFGIGPAWTIHAIAVWACFFYGGWVAVGVVTAWLTAVLLFIPREQLERLAAAIERRDERRRAQRPPASEEPPDEAPAEDGREAILRLLSDLIGDAHGVHLRTVLAHLQKHGQWEGRTVAEMRQHLEALGIPVRPKVKVDGTPTRGVLRADLEALSPPGEKEGSCDPSPAV
jgi:hypothetical protein